MARLSPRRVFYAGPSVSLHSIFSELFPIVYIIMSSANSAIVQSLLRFFTMSFMYTLNRGGPMTDPWGAPYFVGNSSDTSFPIIAIWRFRINLLLLSSFSISTRNYNDCTWWRFQFLNGFLVSQAVSRKLTVKDPGGIRQSRLYISADCQLAAC